MRKKINQKEPAKPAKKSRVTSYFGPKLKAWLEAKAATYGMDESTYVRWSFQQIMDEDKRGGKK